MKKYQIKSIGVSLVLIMLSIGFRYLINDWVNNKWSQELNNLVCVESVVDTVRATVADQGMEPSKRKTTKVEQKRVYYSNEIKRPVRKTIAHVNINSATAEQLKSLPGIGEVLSGRIVKYRDRLGGFCHVNQIKEVYGLPEETVVKIHSFMTCSGPVKLLELNSMSFKEILSHPYFDYEQTKAIKNFTSKYKLDSQETLLRITGADRQWVEKVWAYIDLMASEDQTPIAKIEEEKAK